MYEDLVREILLYFSTNKPPIKPELISFGLGIDIHYTNLPAGSGLLILYNDKQIMLVEEKDPMVRKRFTIAHELGHYFLHDGDSLRFDKKKEREANIFAGTLLLPYFILENYLHLSIPQIAKIFWVSQDTVRIRLEYLRKEKKIY